MQSHTITHHALDGTTTTLTAPAGTNLRDFLLNNNLGPYTRFTRRANCGGRGICATCGVWIADNEHLSPTHWHDKAAKAFGYPRLSCQITIDRDLTVYGVDKWVWGNRRSRERDTKLKSE